MVEYGLDMCASLVCDLADEVQCTAVHDCGTAVPPVAWHIYVFI